MPLDVEVVADPKKFLAPRDRVRAHARRRRLARHRPRARRRRLARRAAAGRRRTKPASLELYLRAYDDRGNEVLTWADPARPREIPLRYEPPTPWYRKWWVYAIGGSVAALATGITVYELTIAPPDKVGGTATVK